MTITLTAEEVERALDYERDHLGGTIITSEQADLAEKVLEFITHHPDAHRQGDWLTSGFDKGTGCISYIEPGEDGIARAVDCKTKACFAGWTAVLDGHEISEDGFQVLVDGDRPVATWAVNRLGLHRYTDNGPHPFNGFNTLRELAVWVHAMRLRATMLEIAAGLRKPVELVQIHPGPDRFEQVRAEDAWKQDAAGVRRG